MNDEQKAAVRLALSDAFVDNAVDFAGIAARVSGHAEAEVERIFFCEVALVCHANLLTPAPPVWTAFDGEWLQQQIAHRLARQRRSAWWRWRDALTVAWLRWSCRALWQAIRRA
ncbi:hypothetical protein GRF61_18095 [Azoarcus sp. TTM-91]|uniref:DUF7079 family protein n=1 Tax=Azoarcus sp. TTM-91 TaxID=2691581 RepID=UPI00145D2F60|nr:hypothetical protein [Azoarcus sp. TTM-91]NMG36364.1 hypothetical protein [Azoarcus sp. TTM-91]